MTSLLWLRRDLRLADHPALLTAAEDGDVVPLVVLDPALDRAGGPRREAYLAAVAALAQRCEGALVVRRGRPVDVVPAVAAEAGARRVHVSAETTPYGRRRDARVGALLTEAGRELVPTGSPYAVGPGVLTTAAGGPYRVFTPYSRAWRDHGWPAPAPIPAGLRWRRGIASEPVPQHDSPHPAGEEAARSAWAEFLDGPVATYAEDRDRPDLAGTSMMSMHLKQGTIHPRTLLHDLARLDARGPVAESVERYATELAWREFYADVLWHRPDSAWGDLKAAFAGLEYDDPATDPQVAALLDRWREGRTGFPLVDAGMRQLREIGWMHNRVRMVTASFLVKDLHVWWPYGARHFLDHLVDGDLASNNHGWQWAAGTGTDAAPYFRVFNPVEQGKRWDPSGDYVRRWVPELAHLPGRSVHEPWKATGGLAHGYPQPCVDHAEERREALRRYDAVRAV
ncbi:cryptochrome/photolyase family protein [Arsenicicoccus dermatophilus]|uniref:cryptochrome/photolyase family protein n=1 Tax=Arsenicicoccus dermatophilus TaxID=1076331 RepID=UPI0039170295